VGVYLCHGVSLVQSRPAGILARQHTALQGRQQELALLQACWTRVCHGQGQVVCLVGEAGIGKSRLAYACQQALGPVRWLTVQALSYGQAMPYHAVLPLLRTLLGVVDTATPAQQRQAIHTLQPYDASPGLHAWLHARTGGNPFFVEELVRTLQRRALLTVRGETYEIAPAARRTVPDTLQSLIQARLDQLPAAEKHLVQVAAVIGPDVPWPVLAALMEEPEDRLHRSLQSLQASAFLYATCFGPEPTYTFTHALLQEAAYGSLLPAQRRALHAQLVEVIVAVYPDRLAEQVERLAHHALRGEVWDKAVTYCQQAGTMAFDRAAFHEAVVYFEQALQALASLPEARDTMVRAIEFRLALVLLLTTMGENGRCLTLLGEAEALAMTLDDRARLGWVLAEIVVVRRLIADHAGAIAVSQQALALAEVLGGQPLVAHCQRGLGTLYARIGRVEEARTALGTAVALYRTMAMTFWLPQTEAVLAQMEARHV